jgi:hypothetical protein
MVNLSKVVRQLKQERDQTRAKLQQLDNGSQGFGRGHRQRTNAGPCGRQLRNPKNHVDSCAKEDCRCSARALGQMESGSKEKVRSLVLCASTGRQGTLHFFLILMDASRRARN